MLKSALSLTRSYSKRVAQIGDNVFSEFSRLSQLHKSVNLGQGFPSFWAPDFIKNAAIQAIKNNFNQYTRPGGHPDLVNTLSKVYSPIFNRSIDPLQEIVTFNGAQEGILSIFASLVNPEDEVILLEPFFDAYINAASILDIKTIGIPLELKPTSKECLSSRDFVLDLNKLEKAITPKTKMIVLNNPHNPTGKVFSKEELTHLVKLLKKYPQILILSDEVYEFMTYNVSHERIALYPDMFDRVISLFSAGKTFSCTGWRVGYCIAPKHLALPILKLHSSNTFCSATPLEVAVGLAFDQTVTNGYLQELPRKLLKKRDKLVNALEKANMNPILPEGGYFVIADTSNIVSKEDPKKIFNSEHKSGLQSFPDFQICKYLTKEKGITGIPLSPFYSRENRHFANQLIRLAFCKDNETIDKACEIILKLK